MTTPYVTVEEADAYFDEKLHVELWVDSPDTDKTKALIQATKIIDALNYDGEKADSEQELEFPRKYTYLDDADETVVSVEDTPQAIKDACCEIAFKLLDEIDPDIEEENLASIAQGFDRARMTYDRSFVHDHLRNGVPSPTAWRLILPYLRDPNRVKISRV